MLERGAPIVHTDLVLSKQLFFVWSGTEERLVVVVVVVVSQSKGRN